MLLLALCFPGLFCPLLFALCSFAANLRILIFALLRPLKRDTMPHWLDFTLESFPAPHTSPLRGS